MSTPSKRNVSSHKHRSKAGSRQKSGPASAASYTKQSKIVALLNAPSGATVAAMMKATGWQQHSVRGFLAGVVRKKLKLDLVSEVGENGRAYRIANSRPATKKAA